VINELKSINYQEQLIELQKEVIQLQKDYYVDMRNFAHQFAKLSIDLMSIMNGLGATPTVNEQPPLTPEEMEVSMAGGQIDQDDE